jgi:phenylalanyl-tRNA synthetase beta chain
MANVKFTRFEFESSLGRKVTTEIEKKINMFGTPLESISSKEIEIEIFPNRPDLLSMQGYLRAFKAFLGKSPGLKKYNISPPEKNYKVKIDPSVKSVRPYTSCAIVKGLSFNDEKIKEIVDLQEKLHSTLGRNRKKMAIGIYPLEKIKLPITYKALPPSEIKFQPLEFPRELAGIQILQKHPAGREYAHLLEGKEKFPIFIDANSKILSMPPIINSHDTGKVSFSTKAVFIECSGFDIKILNKALNIITTTLSDQGGKIFSMSLHPKKITTPNFSAEKISVSLQNTNDLLGLNLKESDLQKLLPKMGYNYKSGKVSIPPWRTDILHEVDIIEDIAIAYGYGHLDPQIPKVSTPGSESKESKIKSKISEILSGLGLLEISTYHLIKKEEAKKCKVSSPISLLNSKTEYKILRPNLLIPNLRILSENKNSEYPQKIFELGTIFSKSPSLTETGIKESQNLIISTTPGNFTEIKQILDYLIQNLSLQYKIKESSSPQLIEGRTGEILIDNNPIGFLGEIHPETLRSFNIKMPIAVLEISLEEIFKLLDHQ